MNENGHIGGYLMKGFKLVFLSFIVLFSLLPTVEGQAKAGNKTVFKNCTELRTVYPNGVKKGHKAYSAKMDRDKDNFACEK